MRIVVTGGLGALGSEVVAALSENGHDPVVASRRTGVDLETGSGLDRVLSEADAVVHTADSSNPRNYRSVTVGAGRALIERLGRMSSPPHLVTISIVGCEQVDYAYYRAKRTADELVLSSDLPATVIRATQFHSLAAFFARVARVGPLVFGIRGMRIQPVDIRWVGRRLAEVSVADRPTGPVEGPDLAGPEIFDVTELSRLVAAHERRRPPRPVGLPPIGAAMRDFSAGRILAGPAAEIGGERFAQWLGRQPRRLRGR